MVEFDLQKALQRAEELQRILDQRTQELKSKELQLMELESEVAICKVELCACVLTAQRSFVAIWTSSLLSPYVNSPPFTSPQG